MAKDERHAPVFLVSTDTGGALAAAIERSGRPVEHAGHISQIEQQFAASPAVLVVVDARERHARGVALGRQIAPAVEIRGGAMVMLVADSDGARDAFMVGATHFLLAPVDDDAIENALLFADRHVRRMRSGGTKSALISAQAALVGSARWEWDVGSADVTISPALAAMIGQRPGTVPIAEILPNVPAGERQKTQDGMRRVLVSGQSTNVQQEMTVDGRRRSIVHHIRPRQDSDGKIIGVTVTVDDTEVSALDRRLSAHFDPVSGLVNQRYAHAWVDQLLGGRGVADPAAAVVLIAISRFEAINAGYGRNVGDAAIQALGRTLRKIADDTAAEGQALAARFGGAEFAVAFAAPIDLAMVDRFCRSVAQMFERPFIVGARVLHLSCRMGVALGEPTLANADALFRRATGALALAKRGEPNSWQIATTGGDDDGHARTAALRVDLRRALSENGEGIEVLFQPMVEIVSSRIVGVEALVRWRHPVMGYLSADTVIEVAEGAELMPRLGRHVMRLAMDEAMKWDGVLAGLRISINVTAHDLRVPDFEEGVISALADTGFPPSRLTLEITESGLMEDIERAAILLSRLRDTGIKIAIDDFGTGYSSLAYLKSLPVDTLKVDKALITDLSGSARDRVVVRGVVEMARSLGIGVVAEGVETHEQLELVVREGCNWFQGYLCSRPLTSEALKQFVPDWQARAAAA